MQALLIDIEGWEIQMERLLKQIEAYKAHVNEQEERKTGNCWIQWIRSGRDIVTRANETAHLDCISMGGKPGSEAGARGFTTIFITPGHGWVVMRTGNGIFRKWRSGEVEEESGLSQVTPLQEAPVSLEILTVDGHWKRGTYVASHLHLNVTYLMEADPRKPIRKKPDENSAVAWIPVEEIGEKSTEPWFVEHIYSKLCKKALTLQ